jgi:5-methylcytosine-specific restriction endonuclease McrA
VTEPRLYQLIKNSSSGKISPRLRLQVLKRDNYTCRICRKQSNRLQADHIIPIEKGGLAGLQNLRTVCYECHIERHGWDYIERETTRVVWSEFDKLFDNELSGKNHSL